MNFSSDFPNKKLSKPLIWVVTEGLSGTENQCIGVAESLGLPYVIHRVMLAEPWRTLSPWLGMTCHCTFSPRFQKPWPDLVIASGRKSIAAAHYIKKKNPRAFLVQLQDPRISPKSFDLVAVPQHDPTRGENVIVTFATPNNITQEGLDHAKHEFAHIFGRIPQPRIGVLIGGSTKRHEFTQAEALEIAAQIKDMKGLMISTSRRTGEENTALLKAELETPDHYFWDGVSPNPYMGILAWADVLLVTSESTSMISECATTGKPVYVLPMKGMTRRQNTLVDNLIAHGAVRHFSGKIEDWTYPSLHDAAFVAENIRQKSGLF